MNDYFCFDPFLLAYRENLFIFYCNIRNVKNAIVLHKDNGVCRYSNSGLNILTRPTGLSYVFLQKVA